MIRCGGNAVSVWMHVKPGTILCLCLRATLPGGCFWLPPGGCAQPWLSSLPHVPCQLLGSGESEGPESIMESNIEALLPQSFSPFSRLTKRTSASEQLQVCLLEASFPRDPSLRALMRSKCARAQAGSSNSQKSSLECRMLCCPSHGPWGLLEF